MMLTTVQNLLSKYRMSVIVSGQRGAFLLLLHLRSTYVRFMGSAWGRIKERRRMDGGLEGGVARSYTYTPFRFTDEGGKRETKENARILNADLYKHSLFAAKLVTYFGPQTTKRVRAGVEFGNCIFFCLLFLSG